MLVTGKANATLDRRIENRVAVTTVIFLIDEKQKERTCLLVFMGKSAREILREIFD